MSLQITAIVLLAAALHAGWNALIKISGDRIAVMALVTLAGSLFSLCFLPFLPAPSMQALPFLALSILLHTGYHFFLPIAYDHGDLGQVYPMARGFAPILITLGALVFAGETLAPLAFGGVLCLALGVMALTFDRSDGIAKNPKAVAYALGTGFCIACYTIVDGLGARQSGSALGFAVWLTVGDGLLTFLLALMWKGRAIWRVARFNLKKGLAGGAMQVGAYWIVVCALTLAPMGMVSALRETSVLFAALLSTFLLKEGFGIWRFVSAGLVGFGLVLSRGQK